LVSFSTAANADLGQNCVFDAAKTDAALVANLTGIMDEWALDFTVKPDSLTAQCSSVLVDDGEANDYEVKCNVNLSAQDGTQFVLQYEGASPGTPIYLAAFTQQRATDDEGNYQGPVNCVSNFTQNFQMLNAKTGVMVVTQGTGDTKYFTVSYPQ
jgi:hypothetical protein